MPRAKRSEKQKEVAVKPAPAVVPVPVAERIVAALCPVCVLPGTKILTPEGYRNIEGLAPGDKLQGQSLQVVNAVYARPYSGNAVTLKARYFMPVSVTDDHPVLVSTLRAVYGSKEDNYKERLEVSVPYLKEAVDIQPNSRQVRHGGGDCLVSPKIHGAEETYLHFECFSGKPYLLPACLKEQVLLTKDLAEFFGWYVSDGSVSEKEVQIYLNVAEPKKVERVANLIVGLGYTYYFSNRTQGCWVLHINSRVLPRFLEYWFGRGARNKKIPQFIMFAKADLVEAFLNGYFGGDGYYRDKRWEANTVSEHLALGLQILSLRIGSPLGLFSDKSWRSRRYIQSREVTPAKVRYCLAGTRGLSLKQKYFEDDSFYYFPVIRKDIFHYEGPVYNLNTTEGIYLLPFIVHNCGRTIPEKRAIKIGYMTVDRIDYFASIEWDENKPFGVSYPASGKGSLRDWEYISPEQAPELFEALKARLIQAVREYINKGWLTEEEIRGQQ